MNRTAKVVAMAVMLVGGMGVRASTAHAAPSIQVTIADEYPVTNTTVNVNFQLVNLPSPPSQMFVAARKGPQACSNLTFSNPNLAACLGSYAFLESLQSSQISAQRFSFKAHDPSSLAPMAFITFHVIAVFNNPATGNIEAVESGPVSFTPRKQKYTNQIVIPRPNGQPVVITFRQPMEAGRYANGDWWVVGPADVTGITPPFNGTYNGYDVNPDLSLPDASYDRRMGYTWRAPRPLPMTLQPGDSLIATVGLSQPLFTSTEYATVLTVVAQPPPSGSFRPHPYYQATPKTPFHVNDLQLNLLPNLDPGTIQLNYTLDQLRQRYAGFQLECNVLKGGGGLAWDCHPLQTMYEPNNPSNPSYYGVNIAEDSSETILQFALAADPGAKADAAFGVVQAGIDYFGAAQTTGFSTGGGQGIGRWLLILFAGAMLPPQNAIAAWYPTRPATLFQETDQLYISDSATPYNGQPRVLWGDRDSAYWYWQVIYNGGSLGSKTIRDPYELIDGGFQGPGLQYQALTTGPYVYTALALALIDELRALANAHPIFSGEAFLQYADRFKDEGAHAVGDPCAPASQGGGHSASSGYGNVGSGGCISDPDLTPGSTPGAWNCQPGKQCGRFPNNQGIPFAGTSFVEAMWTKFRSTKPAANVPWPNGAP